MHCNEGNDNKNNKTVLKQAQSFTFSPHLSEFKRHINSFTLIPSQIYSSLNSTFPEYNLGYTDKTHTGVTFTLTYPRLY